jgi:DNA polymerase
MVRAVGLRRADVFIANILQCRPPQNRDPRPEEVAACAGHLDAQLALVAPKLILAVGRIAAQNLLHQEVPVSRLRGRVHAYGRHATPLVVTYHPAYLLRSPADKRKAWDDLRLARNTVDPRGP